MNTAAEPSPAPIRPEGGGEKIPSLMSVEAQPEPSSGKTVRDAQELTNLRLTEEKLRQDLLDLRRPYLFRNPQLLTALITSVGALVAVSLLVEENYFKTRE